MTDTPRSGAPDADTPEIGPSRTVVFLFDTTHHALWAEEVAQGAGLPAEVIPAPPDRGEARCDLALETFRATAADLGGALTREGVDFYWPDGVPPADTGTSATGTEAPETGTPAVEPTGPVTSSKD